MLTKIAINEQPKLNKKKWLIIGGVCLTLVLLSIGIIYIALNRNEKEPISPIGKLVTEEIKKNEPKLPNPINGELRGETEVNNWSNRYPIGVMIENLNITRPQTGLSRADIVYEALTEGEITRFMGIYLSDSSELGPVRSARLPFLSWILEYDGAYAHVGGSTEALEQIPVLGVKNMDQAIIGAPTFQRVVNRGLGSEHTMFTSAQKLWDKAKELGYSGVPVFSSWNFKDDEVREKRSEQQKLTLKFTGNLDYIVDWVYDPVTNLYYRSNGGIPHRDSATNDIISAKDVIVIFVKTDFVEVSPGKVGREMMTVGKGEARVFRDGISIKGTWVKPTLTSRTKFLDQDGNEIALNRGKIWVEVNPVGSPIEYN